MTLHTLAEANIVNNFLSFTDASMLLSHQIRFPPTVMGESRFDIEKSGYMIVDHTFQHARLHILQFAPTK